MTFESQLLELLREYEIDFTARLEVLIENGGHTSEQETSYKGFYKWLSKRVEEKEVKTKRDKLIALCNKYSQSGFLDNVQDDKEEFINAILDL
jgi:hypothetical protein